MQNQQQPESYAVWLMRRDQQHITVLETKDFKEADSLWRKLTDQWIACLKEQAPFEIRSPVIMAFDPGLIYEIAVLPHGAPNLVDNPYQKNMRQNGFSSTFGSFTRNTDLLDSRY